MLLRDVIKEGVSTLSRLYPEREAREMVYVCLEKLLGTTRHTHILEPDYQVDDEDLAAVRDSFAKMASGHPLQYVLKEAWFYGRKFNVSPDVLIPRPETEILCRTILVDVRDGGDRNLQIRETGISPATGLPVRILDMCTGSGCIAWTLALEMPGAEVVAVDISDGALEIAGSQDFAEEISCTSALSPVFFKADVLGQPLEGLGQFDIITANPPYVMESEKALMRINVLEHEPHLALFVPDDDPLLFYRAVARWALQLLKPGGYGIVEINEALAFATEEVFRDLCFSDVRTLKDLNDRDRFVIFHRPLIVEHSVEQFV